MHLAIRTALTLLTVGIALAMVHKSVAAQEPDALPGRIIGEVFDGETGGSVQGVVVRILPPVDRQAITDEAGRFAFSEVPAAVHELEVSHIAYGAATQLVNVPEGATVEVWVEIMPRAIDVGSIRVRVAVLNPGLEDVGFYDRTRFGFGRFFDEMDLRRQTLASALQEAGARLAGGTGLSSYPVFSRSGRTCVPMLWIDRRMIRFRGSGIEAMVNPASIAAMEVYRPGDTPREFMYSTSDCGAVVIWTQSYTW